MTALSALTLLAVEARADNAPPTDDQKAAARLLGTEGVKLAMSGDCNNAVDKLSRAEALVHAPTTAYPLAQCEIKLGKLVAGTEILNRIVHEQLPSTAPKSWSDAKQQSQALLDATSPRIPKLRIHVDRPGGVGQDVQVTVDGEAVPLVLLDNDRPTDPGTHRVAATASGSPPAETTVTLAEGQTQSVGLELQAPPPVAATPAPTAATAVVTTTPAESTTPRGPNRVPAYVLFGVGGVGLVVGSVFGVLALNAKSSLQSHCEKLVCPTSSQSDINAYKTDPIVSTVGFGVGIAAVAVGTVLFFTAHGENPPPKTARLEMRPWVGPGSAGVGGSFP